MPSRGNERFRPAARPCLAGMDRASGVLLALTARASDPIAGLRHARSFSEVWPTYNAKAAASYFQIQRRRPGFLACKLGKLETDTGMSAGALSSECQIITKVP